MDKPLCHKPILNSHLATNASIYMATDLMNKRGEIHYITNYISWPTHYNQKIFRPKCRIYVFELH